MPWVINSGAFPGDRERLARAGGGPEGSVFRPPGDFGRHLPEPGPGEEVSPSIPGNVSWLDFFDASFIDMSFMIFPQHGACDGVNFVEIGHAISSASQRQFLPQSHITLHLSVVRGWRRQACGAFAPFSGATHPQMSIGRRHQGQGPAPPSPSSAPSRLRRSRGRGETL